MFGDYIVRFKYMQNSIEKKTLYFFLDISLFQQVFSLTGQLKRESTL